MKIANNGIGNEGAKFIAEFIEKSHRLTRLKLATNAISDAGCKRLATALEKKPIEILDLGMQFFFLQSNAKFINSPQGITKSRRLEQGHLQKA